MLPKKSRLSAEEVRTILKAGRSVRRGTVSARFEATNKAGRAAVVVSAKVARKATVRNRLRRGAYAALPSPLPKGNLVLFIQSPAYKTADILSLCSTLS